MKLTSLFPFQMIMQGSQTLGKTKKSKTAQRHSAGNIDYDNLPGSQESDDIPSQPQHTFRSRSKTVGDGKYSSCIMLINFIKLFCVLLIE